MKIISKYIAKEFLYPFLITLISFILVFFIVDLFDNLDETLKYKVSAFTIIHYYLLSIPNIIVISAPLSTMLATFYVIKTFNRHNEFVAIRIGGVSLTGFLKPFFMIGICITLGIFFLNETLVPQTKYKANNIKKYKMRAFKHENKKPTTLRNLSFIDNNNNIYYIESFDIPTKTLRNIIIIEYSANIMAKSKKAIASATWDADSQIWHAEKIIIDNYDQNSTIKKRSLDKMDLLLTATPKEVMHFRNQTDYMSSTQLRTLIKKFSKNDKIIRNRLLVDYHKRLSEPIFSLVILLFSLPLALFRSRSGTLTTIVSGMTTLLLFFFMIGILNGLGKGGNISPFLAAWIPCILFGAGGLGAIYTFHK